MYHICYSNTLIEQSLGNFTHTQEDVQFIYHYSKYKLTIKLKQFALLQVAIIIRMNISTTITPNYHHQVSLLTLLTVYLPPVCHREMVLAILKQLCHKSQLCVHVCICMWCVYHSVCVCVCACHSMCVSQCVCTVLGVTCYFCNVLHNIITYCGNKDNITCYI